MDLKAHDPHSAAEFLTHVLGWRFAVDENDWRRATKIYADGEPIGGVSDLSDPVYPPGTPAHLAHYLAVDDVDRRTEAATGRGARLVVPPFDAGDQGRMATLLDPFGAAVSFWQARTFSGWTEPRPMVLGCADPDGARRFYRDVLGAEPHLAEFAAGGPPGWRLTVAVDDLPAAVARAGDRFHDGLLHTPEGPVLGLAARQPGSATVRSTSIS
ncbi:VOC family protein [Streptomyces sp. NPDC020141]|uniref:VOC family protein n=1 Tax=Streptomyces sp. NPDC020141 TaxID=3365065 RepID=UPI00379A2565